MDSVIVKVGDKEYDLSKMGEQELTNLSIYVKDQEKVVVDNILDNMRKPEYDLDKIGNDFKIIKDIRIKVRAILKTIEDEKERKSVEEAKVNPVDEVDNKYNATVDSVANAYDKVRSQLSDKINNIEDEKENLIKDLLENTPRRELTEEDQKMVDDLLEEFDRKNRSIDTLVVCNSKLLTEEKNNVQVMLNTYNFQTQEIVVAPERKSVFARLRDFISTKLQPKKLENKVYQDKQNKLSGIVTGIKTKMAYAKKQADEVKKVSFATKIKTSVALALQAFTMLSGAPTVMAEQYNDDIQDQTAYTEEYDFKGIEEVANIAAGAGLKDDGETIEIDAELDDQKVEDVIAIDEAIFQETRYVLALEKSDLTEQQIRSVITKFVEITSSNLSKEEQVKALKKFYIENKDDVTLDQFKHILDIYKTKLKVKEQKEAEKGPQQAEVEAEVTTPEKTPAPAKTKGKTKKVVTTAPIDVEAPPSNYDKIIDLNKNIDGIQTGIPAKAFKDAIKFVLKGEFSETEIDEMFDANETLDQTELKKMFKESLLNKYLYDTSIDDPTVQQDYKTVEAMFTAPNINIIKDNVSKQYPFIKSSDIQAWYDSGMSDREILAMVNQKINEHYRVQNLSGDSKKAYDLVEGIIGQAPSGEWRSLLTTQLGAYIPQSVITQIYDECDNQRNQDKWNLQMYEAEQAQPSVSTNVSYDTSAFGHEIFTDENGEKYIIDVDGEPLYVSDDVLAQLSKKKPDNWLEGTPEGIEEEKPVIKDAFTIDMEFKSSLKSKLQEYIINLDGKDMDLYNSTVECIMFTVDHRASVTYEQVAMEKIEKLPAVQSLLKEGIIDKEDIKNIVNSEGTGYQKVDSLYKLIEDGKEELSVDEDTKEAFAFIKDNIKMTNANAFIDGLDDLVPLDAMKEIGILEQGQIETILLDGSLTDKQKVKAIKDIIKDGNKKLEKLGYKQDVEIGKDVQEEDNERD